MASTPQPLGGNEMPRFGGIATFMRLPGRTPAGDLDVAVVGVPFDIGTSNRPGARFGPRAIRDESVLLRPYNMATRAAPFDSLRIDDIGDVATNPYDLTDSVARIEARYHELLDDGSDHRHHGRRPHDRPADPARHGPPPRSGRARPRRCPHRHQRHHVRRTHRTRHAVPTRRRGGPARPRTRSCRSACAAPATRPTTSTGPAGRASGSCRSRSAGSGVSRPAHGRGARPARHRPGLSQLRHRRSRSGVRSRHRAPPRSAASPCPRPSRSSAAAVVSISSAPTSSRSRRSTTPAARRP